MPDVTDCARDVLPALIDTESGRIVRLERAEAGPMAGRVLAVAALAVLIRCGGADAAASSGSDAAGSPDWRRSTMISDDMQSIVEAVLNDAAGRTGRERSALVIVRREAVTWPDGSLGCPEPGVMYTMAPVRGYRIGIRAGEQVLDYHANRRGYFVLCPPGRSVDPAPGSI